MTDLSRFLTADELQAILDATAGPQCSATRVIGCHWVRVYLKPESVMLFAPFVGTRLTSSCIPRPTGADERLATQMAHSARRG